MNFFKSILLKFRIQSLPEGLGLGWLVTGFLFTLAFLSQSFDSDLNFWQAWMKMHQNGGYAALQANYPPVLLHWIALGGGIFSVLGIQETSLLLIKVWVEIPVWLAWMLLLFQVARALEERGISPRSSGVFWFTVFNPALYLDGPIWGQVDLLPWIPLSLGLLAHIRNQHWQGPIWFALALAIKFQSIVFAPIFAALFIRALWQERKVLLGALGAIGVMFLSFLPFVWVGRGWEHAGDAYWDNVGMYPYATYNATNLWYLLMPKDAMGKDSIPGFESWGFMTPSFLGLALFGSFALLVFVLALRKQANLWALGVLSMFAFFAFSAEMHERYLFGAVPMAAMWAAHQSRGRIWYVIATLAVAYNIALLLFPDSTYEWNLLSLLIVLSVPFLLIHSMGLRLPHRVWTIWDQNPLKTMLISALIPVLFFGYLVQQQWLAKELHLNIQQERSMAQWTPTAKSQEWDQPKWATQIWERSLGFKNQTLLSGIKVHAKSQLLYSLPEGTYRIHGFCGPEKEAGDAAEMRFEVALNGTPIWSSPVLTQNSSAFPVDVIVVGPADLELRVDPQGANHGDHALWGDLKIQRLK
jgi:Gpi18-like mannosyltransferase